MAKFFTITRERTEDNNSPFWISYADLMTALVMLFLVVMSISMVAISSYSLEQKRLLEQERKLHEEDKKHQEEEKFRQEEEKKQQRQEKIQREQEIDTVLAQLELMAHKRGIDLSINRLNHTISFGEMARFPVDSYLLTEEVARKLQEFVPVLLEARAQQPGLKWLKRVHIEGYTDETGTYLYNVNLSLNRAQSVVCAMMAANLTTSQQREMRQIMTIDGATVTGIKASRDESRRVEVRLEFRQLGDDDSILQAPDMNLGTCFIRSMVEGKGGDKGKR